MANPRVLTDTSVIIDFLRKQNKRNAVLWRIRENNKCFMSSVTLFELQFLLQPRQLLKTFALRH